MSLERRTRTLDLGSRVDGLLLLGRGTLVAAGGANGATRVWDGRTGATVAALPPRTQGGVVDIAPGARPAQLVLASTDGIARVWDFRAQGAEALLQLRPGHTNHLTSVDTAGTRGFFVLTASEDTTARVSDGDRGRQLTVLAGHTAPVVRAELAGDGRTAVTASLDGTARVWDPGIRPELEPSGREPPTDPALVARSPDGTVTATAEDEVVVLEDGARHELRGHTAAVNAVDFSPDGELLVTAGRDGDARVWDVATGEPALLLRGHFGSVADARFSPDGRWIVTAGPISAGLWSTSTGELVAFLYGPTRPDAASFAADGRAIVTREPDGTIRGYDCEICSRLPGLVALAEARLAASGRRLTDEERAAYLG
jgi:WD40 repeat protein